MRFVKRERDETILENIYLLFIPQEELPWRPGTSYLSWGGHVMYLPPAPEQPLSMMGPIDRPVRYVPSLIIKYE